LAVAQCGCGVLVCGFDREMTTWLSSWDKRKTKDSQEMPQYAQNAQESTRLNVVSLSLASELH
jgi:hypothetical protein